MFDQLIIGNVASYDDFGASVAERKIVKPKKKSIKETVPFSNLTHDFSAINGEVYWEEAKLEYIFEMDADSAEELEEKKIPFVSWIMNVMNEELHDPYIQDFHFLATFDEIDVDDSEVEKATIKVTFTAYPYMIANYKKRFSFAVSLDKLTIEICNDSSHRIIPTIVSDVPCAIIKGDSGFGIPEGETTDEKFTLNPGVNTMVVATNGKSGTLKIEFYEEVF